MQEPETKDIQKESSESSVTITGLTGMTTEYTDIDQCIETVVSRAAEFSIPHRMIIHSLTDGTEVPESIREEIACIKGHIESFNADTFQDITGSLYQKLQSSVDKKNKGQFFTPEPVADYIISEAFPQLTADTIFDFTLMDPACGSGQFLIRAYRFLFTQYTSLGFSEKQAAESIISYNIFGCDRDKTALEITAFNLSKISGISKNGIRNLFHNDFIYKDSFSLEQDSLVSREFDLIIGNPPWGSSLSAEEKKYYRQVYYSAKSGVNTFTLFIERSLDLLKEKGRLAFLIPQALLNIKAHKNCRELLINNTNIESVTLWGEQFKDVYAPSVSLTCEKDSTHNKKGMIRIADRISKTGDELFVKQSDFRRTPDHIISIHFSESALNIIEHISSQNCYYLKDSAQFFLGIVTGNNPKYIAPAYSDMTPDPIIMGKDVSPYKINHSGHFFKYDPKILQQTAPKNLYESKDKIIYKFIGKKLTFAMDREGLFTLNNVNGFIPDMDTVSAEAMLAILNSSLIQYFYEKSFFTVKVLRGNLERLPIKKLSTPARKMLSDLAKEAMETDGLSRTKEIQDTIDDIVFHEYDIAEKDAYHIWEEHNSSKRQQVLPNL